MNTVSPRRSILRSPEFLIGLFCLGAMVILFYFTVLIRGKDILDTRKYFYLSASFPHASTLAVNDKVKVLGVDMGTVESVELGEGNSSIIVKMKLRKHIPVYEGYSISIQSSSVFGGAYVNINPGPAVEELRLPDNSMFKGLHPIDLTREASELIAAFREDEKYFREFIIQGGILDKIKDALSRIEENARNLNDICAEIKAGKGTLGKLFTDPSFYDNAQNAFHSMASFSRRFDAILTDVENGKGAFGFLLRDENAAEDLRSFIVNMNSLAKRLNQDQSTFVRLLADNGEFFKNLNSALKNMDRITSLMNSGKGTLGQLLQNDELYVEMTAAVRELRTAVNDFREMAPVATFGSVLLGAF